LCALCTLLLCIAASWVMPRSARAQQLSVGQIDPGPNNASVQEYDATAGALINRNFVTGLNSPRSLAMSGNTRLVATNNNGMVGSYDATRGAVINVTEGGSVTTVAGTPTVTFPKPFSQVPTVTSTVAPGSINPRSTIVATPSSQTTTGFVVDTVDTSTGLPANATVNWAATGGISALTPAIIQGLAVSGNTLFVVHSGAVTGGTVGAYDATTGAVSNANLVTLNASVTGLAVGATPLRLIANGGPNQTAQVGTLVFAASLE
jgi:hypothetical protein